MGMVGRPLRGDGTNGDPCPDMRRPARLTS